MLELDLRTELPHRVVRRILSDHDRISLADDAILLGEACRSAFRYVNDPTDFEVFQRFRSIWSNRAGDCDEINYACRVLCEAAGIPTAWVVGERLAPTDDLHMWCLCDVGGAAVHLDPTTTAPMGSAPTDARQFRAFTVFRDGHQTTYQRALGGW